MKLHHLPKLHLALALLAVAAISWPATALAQDAAEAGAFELRGGPISLDWNLGGDFAGAALSVSRPDGSVFAKQFAAGERVTLSLFDAKGEALADGSYTWELTAAPRVRAAAQRKAEVAREAGATDGKPLGKGLQRSGSFSIVNGAFVVPGASTRHDAAREDQVIPDDIIVQGSACVGLDCVNGEIFGFDTIRMKENNTRLQFNDTSTTAGFPTFNWQIRANSSANGGANFLAFVDQGATGDSETGKILFQVTGGAPANSLFVDSSGRVGLRTSTPVLDLHVKTSNTPSMRLEQDSSGGFSAQTWDIAGNEANFFVRDVTSGSRLPFRIRPQAPTSSIDIGSTGNVGIGTASPTASIHVRRTDGTAQVKVEEASTNGAGRTLFNLENNGQVKFRMKDTAQAPEWVFTASNAFQIDNLADAGVEFQINPNGAILVNGSQVHAADYVFAPDYELMPLPELAGFIADNRHLPNVPNAEQVKREGLNLVAFPIKLLEKIEELTLYALAQHEELVELGQRSQVQQQEIAALKAQLAALQPGTSR